MMYMINVLVCEIIASVDYCFSLLETMANALVLLSYVLFKLLNVIDLPFYLKLFIMVVELHVEL